MAHFARLDENNTVLEVVVIDNNDIIDENGNESEEKGIAICQTILGQNTIWKQTSYNKNFRDTFASIGMIYDPEKDIFIDTNLPEIPQRRFFEHI